MNRLIIIGASGHGKVVADIAKHCGYNEIVFLDDNESIKTCGGFPVIGKTDNIPDGDLFIAVGKTDIRERITRINPGKHFPVLIHPNAVIADDTEIGSGTVVMAGTVVNPGVIIGQGCIINTSSSIDHDCVIGDYCHISVGVHLSGTVIVGKRTWIGAGAIVSNNIEICSDCLIGAGAVVIRDINEPGTYVGVPAKMSKERNADANSNPYEC